MNLAEVLNVALPELPARRLSTSYPRLHPNVIAREQMEGGVPTMVAMVSGGSYVMRFTPDQWKLIQLFNGQRSYGEVIELYQQESGVAFAEEDVRNFVDSLERRRRRPSLLLPHGSARRPPMPASRVRSPTSSG